MSSHWLSRSQWQWPKREQYPCLQRLLANKAREKGLASPLNDAYSDLAENDESLQQDYGLLYKQYDELRQQCEKLRRPFSADVPYTDFRIFRQVCSYPGKHPCEKPADLRQHIITSSRPGDVVADPFRGSGATVRAALTLGRKATGVEREGERFIQTKSEI